MDSCAGSTQVRCGPSRRESQTLGVGEKSLIFFRKDCVHNICVFFLGGGINFCYNDLGAEFETIALIGSFK